MRKCFNHLRSDLMLPRKLTLAVATKPDSIDIGPDLDKIAQQFATGLLAKTAPTPEELAAFKALTTFYAVRKKTSLPDDDPEKGGFGGHLDTLSGLGRGGGARANGGTDF